MTQCAQSFSIVKNIEIRASYRQGRVVDENSVPEGVGLNGEECSPKRLEPILFRSAKVEAGVSSEAHCSERATETV